MKFVIGDIHGEISKLKLLVSIIKKRQESRINFYWRLY